MSRRRLVEGVAVRYDDAMKTCPRHGLTLHLGCAGGRCCLCQDEILREKGLVKP